MTLWLIQQLHVCLSFSNRSSFKQVKNSSKISTLLILFIMKRFVIGTWYSFDQWYKSHIFMTEIFSLQETQRPIHQHFFVTWVLPNLISLIVFGIAYLVEKNLQNLRSLVIILKFLFHVLSVELKLKNSHEFRCFIVASLLIVAIYIYI